MHRNARRGSEFAGEADRWRIDDLVERFGNEWIATARRAAATPADAEDAYQRALEKLLTAGPATEDPEQVAAWMHVVIKNEALQARRARRHEVDTEFELVVGGLAADSAMPEERALDAESHGAAREALKRLRPDQLRCLLLRADGSDYPEICRATGFSYAKVNRLLSEGRKAARMRDDAITAGHECERLEPTISQMVDGVLDRAAEADLRMHIEHCGHCRAVARDYAVTPRDLAAVLPVGVLLAESGWFQRLVGPLRSAIELVQARLAGGNPEVGLAAAKKAVAVVAAGATIVGGGVVVQHARESHNDLPAGPAMRSVPTTSSPRVLSERRVRKARAAKTDRSADEAIGRIASDPASAPEPRASDVSGEADTAVAEDPANRPPSDSPPDQSGVLAP